MALQNMSRGVLTRASLRGVFFGAYDPDAEPIGLVERLGSMFTRIPAVREAMPAGDFRDRAAIEAWAEQIASELDPAQGRATQPVGA